MNARTSILALAIASLLAATGAAFAYGPGPHAGMGPRAAAPMDPAQHAERVQSRLEALKEALKLAPVQLDAWNTYAAKVAAEAQTRAQMRQGIQGSRGDAQAMADQRVATMKHNAQAAEDINGLRKALVATLTAEQKATFEQYETGPRFARGHGFGPGGGRGQGHGPGPGGGRGAGVGGCIGAA